MYAGEPIDVADIRGLDHDGTVAASIVTMATDFSDVSSTVRTALHGQYICFVMYISTTNALTATTGNIIDIACCTLAAAYRPIETVSACFGNGLMTGECTLNPSGVVTLRSASDTVSAGSNIRATFNYLTT